MPAATPTATVTAATVTAAQEALIRENMPLVGHMVREMLFKVPPHVHRDDLASAGYAALVTAAQAFDPQRGIPFGKFAAVRVRGALLDELRSSDWASRSVRARARRADVARQELTAKLVRTPTATELAELLGVGVAELASVEDDVQRAAVLSLQGFTAGAEDMVTDGSLNPEEMLLHRERLGYLHDAVAVLPERLRYVVEASFLQERPLAEVAAELGVTESRVSQLRTEALALLRDGLSTHLDGTDRGAAGGDGCVARRRAAYAAQIAGRSTMASRLAVTDVQGMRIPSAA
jgi:RNA polymerase sigma factor FliA